MYRFVYLNFCRSEEELLNGCQTYREAFEKAIPDNIDMAAFEGKKKMIEEVKRRAEELRQQGVPALFHHFSSMYLGMNL